MSTSVIFINPLTPRSDQSDMFDYVTAISRSGVHVSVFEVESAKFSLKEENILATWISRFAKKKKKDNGKHWWSKKKKKKKLKQSMNSKRYGRIERATALFHRLSRLRHGGKRLDLLCN